MNSAFCLRRPVQSSPVKNGCCFTSQALPADRAGTGQDGSEQGTRTRQLCLKPHPPPCPQRLASGPEDCLDLKLCPKVQMQLCPGPLWWGGRLRAWPTCAQSLQRVLVQQFGGEVLGIWGQCIVTLGPHNLICSMRGQGGEMETEQGDVKKVLGPYPEP